MQGLSRVLVDVQEDEGPGYVLEKAARIATAAGADLFVVQVVYDANVDSTRHDAEARQQLKTLMMQAGEEWLVDLIAGTGFSGKIDSATLWHKHRWEGILDAARDCEADLVMKASHQPEGLDAVLYAPQDWHLLRHADVPVMMVKPSAWVDRPVILAAIDALHQDQETLSRRILREASSLAEVLNGDLDIVVAHPFVQPLIGPSAVPIDFDKVRREAEQEITDTVARLTGAESVRYRYLHIEEGSTANAVGHSADETGAEVLVMGTVARDGIKGLVLGNTSETILYRVNCDVAVLR